MNCEHMIPGAECRVVGCGGWTLTPSQYEVVRRMALGQDHRSIARELGIARTTIYNHRTEALHRSDSADIYALWMKLGWLRVPGAAPVDIPATVSVPFDREREPSGAATPPKGDTP